MTEPNENHFYGFRNQWHYAANKKVGLPEWKLEHLEPETVFEFNWPKIIALAVCLGFWLGVGKLLGWL